MHLACQAPRQDLAVGTDPEHAAGVHEPSHVVCGVCAMPVDIAITRVEFHVELGPVPTPRTVAPGPITKQQVRTIGPDCSVKIELVRAHR